MLHSSLSVGPRRSRWSLARRLAALFFILLTLVVGAFGTSAYVGVRESAVERSSERLASVARELAASVSRGVVVRRNAMRLLARDSTIVRALSAARIPQDKPLARSLDAVGSMAVQATTLDTHRASLDSLFARRRTRADTAVLGWHVLSAGGERLHGSPLATRDSLELSIVVGKALRTDSVVHSVLYESESQVRLFVAVPVALDDGEPLGVIAAQRVVLGTDSIEGAVTRITGQNASVAYASRGSEEWSSVRGQRIPSPLGPHALSTLPDTGTVRLVVGNDSARYVASAPVSGAPWRIVLTEGEDSILERPRALLRRLIVIAVTVLLLGTLGAWWLSHLETRPLTALRNAAEAMASGEYKQIVTPAGAEETAALADAFNTMSIRISGVHATLAAQNQALIQANEAKARFLAVMSHELRTPLNAIGGYGDLMALGVYGPTTDDQRVALERIGRSRDQLLHLVSDILSYARLEAAPLRLSRESISVKSQFDAVRETVGEQFARKGVQLVTRATDATIHADPVRMQQILINLVSNALQYTPAGGRVDMYAEMSNSAVTLFVRDTGVGIATEEQKSIFEAFVQGDNTLTRRAGGAGLGLAIVRQLATAMGGSVDVESTLGVGSTFSVTLPRDDHAPTDQLSAQSALVGAAN